MPTSSTLVSVETALVDLLRRRYGSDVRVDGAPPGEDKLERDNVYLGDVRGEHTDAAMKAGRRWRDESYSIDVVVWTLRPGAEVSEAKAAAVDLWETVENVLADNPTLGVEGVTGAGISEFEVSAMMNPNGAVCQIVLSVDITARLT